MKIPITFGTTVLALAAIATTFASLACQSTRSGRVYLVGVAGGG